MPNKAHSRTTTQKDKKGTTNQNRKLSPKMPRPRKGTKMADLQTKPDAYLECREMRHALVRIGYFHWSDNGKRAICRVSVCQRCGVVKDSFFYASGKLMDSRYDYPDHYLLIGDGKVTNADVVLESMRRMGIAANREAIVTDSPSRRLRAVGT